MYISQEWQTPHAAGETAVQSPRSSGPLARLYRALADGLPDASTRQTATDFLHEQIASLQASACGLPERPEDLLDWMEANALSVHARYGEYLQSRRDGAPRRYFPARAHALHFLRSVAPTKLVDGSWLFGLTQHWRNPRLSDLVRTYVEELGEGLADKNHVLLYRRLLAAHALDPLDGLDDELYRQGAIQLALGWNAEQFLPEVVGFNLGYEQLPLHLLITAYELNELGIDPYYFTLHVTVDNTGTGHARRACQAVLDLLPRLDDGGEFWRRVRIGSQLADAGIGTTAVIEGFHPAREVLRILRHKAPAGAGAHSDYCRVAGRSVNDWLASPATMPGFLDALRDAGWIRPGEPAQNSRFWKLLMGPRAEMFGVFSAYELQVIHDWIAGDSADGRAFDEAPDSPRRRPTFRAMQRARHATAAGPEPLDPELEAFRTGLLAASAEEEEALLVDAMSPALHWTPAGLEATRRFWRRWST